MDRIKGHSSEVKTSLGEANPALCVIRNSPVNEDLHEKLAKPASTQWPSES